MSPDRLIYMANQIGRFFAIQPHEEAVAAVSNHILKFWDPRMRKQIIAHFEKGGAGLDPIVLEAIAKIAKAPQPAP
jgi:formate dehydrogenase subunit delta